MFCCFRRFTKKVDYMNDEIQILKQEILNLKLDFVKENFELKDEVKFLINIQHEQINELEELKVKHQKNNENIDKIISSFAFKQFIVFKLILLTKKQTIEFLDNVYKELDIKYRIEDLDFAKCYQAVTGGSVPCGYNREEMNVIQDVLANFKNLKEFVEKLPEYKENSYFQTFISDRWVMCAGKSYNSDHFKFHMNTIVKTIKDMNL